MSDKPIHMRFYDASFFDFDFDNEGYGQAQHFYWQWGSDDWNDIIAYLTDPTYVAPIDWKARAEKAESELAALRAKAVNLAVNLQNLLSVYSQPDRRMCCDGRECGCMGSTVYDEAEHYARVSLAEWEGKP